MAVLSSPDTKATYAACRQFVDRCLKQDDSLFTPGRPIWTLANIDDLFHRFVENPDAGTDSFLTKWKRQLDGAPLATIQFSAELLYIHLLAGNHTTGATKRQMIQAVCSWSNGPVQIPNDLAEALDTGFAAEGTAWKTYRWALLAYLVRLLQKLKGLPKAEQAAIIDDPWRLRDLTNSVDLKYATAQQAMLLHMIHPPFFEPIMSVKIKKLIALQMTQKLGFEASDDIDRQLLRIREALSANYGEGFSFYRSDIRPMWDTDASAPGGKDPIHNPAGTASYWKIAPGKNARLWHDWEAGGHASIGWEELGDLTHLSLDEFRKRRAKLKKRNPKWTNTALNQVWRFAKTIKPGDRVVANRGTLQVLGIGTVTGDYYFVPGVEHGHRLPVRWDDLSPRDIDETGWRRTLVELDQATFHKIAGSKSAPLPPQPAYWPLLSTRKNAVFYGPPGTGKTREALQMAAWWRSVYGDAAVRQVTFHPSFAYEDFVEGFRPDKDGRFHLHEGIFRQMCSAAAAEPDRPFLLIIDELNRGDVARIFGELITLIESDKRDAKAQAILPYSHTKFTVPGNLHILGTMNTADRSISLLDIAIRRRFCFIEFAPDPAVIDHSPEHVSVIEGLRLSSLLRAINQRLLKAGVDRDRSLGHSHLLIANNGRAPIEVLRERIRYDIAPLIEEYCYADRSLVGQVLGRLVTDDGAMRPQVLNDDQQLIKVLKHLCNGEATSVASSEPSVTSAVYEN